MRGRLFASLFAVVFMAACGSGGNAPAAAPSTSPVVGTLTILEAASLTESFADLARGFEAKYPGVLVANSFGASSTLATQLQQGAPGDLFASADQANMDRVDRAGLLAAPSVVFAHNRLEIAVAPGNPKQIAGLADLGQPGLKVVLCQAAVPCGRYASQALAKAGAQVTPVSQEIDVKSVLGRVEQGEADAGIVYATDVFSAGKRVAGVTIPDTKNVIADYPIGILKAGHANLARRFLDYIRSAAGRASLSAHKFSA